MNGFFFFSDELVQTSVRHIQTATDYAFAMHAQQPDLIYGGLAGLVAALLLVVVVVKCRAAGGKQVKKQAKKAE